LTLRWIIVNFFTFENSIKKIFLQPEGHISLKWLLYALFRYSGSSVKKKRHLRSDAFLYDLQQQQFVVCRVCSIGNGLQYLQYLQCLRRLLQFTPGRASLLLFTPG
jgi:hypothetical protein